MGLDRLSSTGVSLKQPSGQRTLYTMEIEQTENCDIVLKSALYPHSRTHLRTKNWENSNKCNQCDFVSSRAGDLKRHLKTHSGEKPNKCNQCDYASSRADILRTHLKTHSGEKSNKCNQCDYASSQRSHLRRHLKKHSGEKSNK